MRVIKKNVYYCDFCNKKSLRSLKEHEKHCTANPDRTCRLCETLSIRSIIEKYAGMFVIDFEYIEFGMNCIPRFFEEFSLDDIENDVECPNCILTILRCVGLNRWYFGEKFKYDYKVRLKDWWDTKNSDRYENYAY